MATQTYIVRPLTRYVTCATYNSLNYGTIADIHTTKTSFSFRPLRDSIRKRSPQTTLKMMKGKSFHWTYISRKLTRIMFPFIQLCKKLSKLSRLYMVCKWRKKNERSCNNSHQQKKRFRNCYSRFKFQHRHYQHLILSQVNIRQHGNKEAGKLGPLDCACVSRFNERAA